MMNDSENLRITGIAKRIYSERLTGLHTATSLKCIELADANKLSESEVKMLLEQEIKTRLWRAAVDEAEGNPRQPLKITEVELTGWRNRCETWGKLSVNSAILERTRSVVDRINATQP